MHRLHFFACILCLWNTASVVAEDYLLRFDALLYSVDPLGSDAKPIDQSADEDDLTTIPGMLKFYKNTPVDQKLHSLEVLVRPNLPFFAKVERDKETIILSGKLKPAKDGQFKVNIRYRQTIDTGTKVPIADNQFVSLPDESGVSTIIGISPDEPFPFAGAMSPWQNSPFQTKSKAAGQADKACLALYVLTLTAYQPPKK